MGRPDPPWSPKSAMVAKGFFVLGLDGGPAPCQPRGRPGQRICAVHADARASVASATGRRKRRGRKDEEAAGEQVLDSMEMLLFHSSIHYQWREELLMRWMEGNKPESYCQFYSNSRTLARCAKMYKACEFYRIQPVKDAQLLRPRRGQGPHGQPRCMVLASDERMLFDIGYTNHHSVMMDINIKKCSCMHLDLLL